MFFVHLVTLDSMKFSQVITGDHNTTYQQEQHCSAVPTASLLTTAAPDQSRCFSFRLGSKILLSTFANIE
jgi:hypothetical protein